MANEDAVKTIYAMVISGSAVIILGLTSLVVKNFVTSIADNKKELEKEVADLKLIIKEGFIEIKKDLNECFSRIRDLENIQNIIKTEHDFNHRRGKHD